MANTIFTQNYICLTLATFGRCQASKLDHPTHHLGFNSKIKYNRFSTPVQNLGLRFQNDCTTKIMSMIVYANIPSGSPLPVDPNSPGHWKVWILGTIVTILLSLSKGRWGSLLQLKDKIGTTIDEAKEIADIVEEVSEKVDKVAEEAEKELPEGKLQDVVEFIEKVAEDINKHTRNAEDALQKVEGIEKELESLIESAPHQEKTTVAAIKAQDQK